jgi:hypothetical protein
MRQNAPVDSELDLDRLLTSMDPQLQPGIFVFCALAPDDAPPDVNVQMLFREREAVTVVVSLADAERNGLAGKFPSQWIILRVHSDLAAVGFLAAVTTALAAAGISANTVSAFHHDHLFVPDGRGAEAMGVLHQLQRVH